MDWIAELEQTEDTRLLEDTLSVAADEPDYLEVDGASRAIAAAEVVAALAGLPTTLLPAVRPRAALGETIRSW
jgi:hypothetical protein